MADLMDRDYASYLTTTHIHIEEEMKKLDDSDYVFSRALLTAIMRENHFTNCSLLRRIKNGDLLKVLKG